jgi:putative transposase
LKKINVSCSNSLLEGLEEILTLHKLNVTDEFKRSFQTTNCIESINSQLKKFTGRVTHWTTSEQRYRWFAAALLEIESRIRKVHNFKNLKKLKKAIQHNLHFHHEPS